MKKFLFILAAVLQVAIAGAQQVDTTGFYSEKRDTLKAAAVTVRRDLVTADADKLTYNVQADPKAEGSNLIDILRAVPMLSINGDEEVLLNGSNDYKVLVNGRSTGMLARNFNQLIKTIPASSIKEIQVITNPPVKYDAEGIGGIINIVLARRLKSGYSGSLGANASTIGSVSGNGYLNAQLGKFTFSANASGMYYPTPKAHGVTDIENYSSDDHHYQRLDFTSDNPFYSGAFSLEASYEPDSLNLITLSGWTNFQKQLGEYDITESFWNTSRVKTIEMQQPTVRTNRYNTFSGELAYQKTFRNDGGILTFSYAIDGNPNSTENDVIVVPILNYPDYHRHSFNTEHTIQQVGQIDYFATLQKTHQIESGAKYTLRSHVADSQDELWDYAEEKWVIDDSNVNDLDYQQHIFAAYASYGYRFSKLTLKAGTRLEYTLNRGLSKSASGNLTFDNSNFNIVPYLNAAWKIDSRNTLSASYTRRLGRPSVTYLNPYIFEESPYSKMHGNPDLRTVVSDALTLTYRTSGETWDLTARTYGSLCNNKIEYLSEVYPDGVKVSTYENAVTYNHINQMLSFNWNPGQRFSLQSSAQVGYNYFYAPSLNQKNDGVEWAFDLSTNVVLWNGATAFASGSISGGETTLQRTYHGVDYAYSLGLRQGFLQNRLVLSVSAIMPFQNRYAAPVRDTYTDTYYQHNESWHNPRQFRLGVTWRFGKTTINFKHAKKTEVSDKL
ncbi:MAG: outer membrane beta-barrel protein [Bacteroidales bacterium]|nr:outer membrane beta-barrel protein [Bacteroidales bacterium]